jgi:hypothetical protein
VSSVTALAAREFAHSASTAGTSSLRAARIRLRWATSA